MQRYTFILPESRIESDDVVVASGLSQVEVAELVRRRDGASVLWSEFEHEGFRCFEMVQLATRNGSHRRTMLSATVPITKNVERDRALAMRLIDIQTIDRHGELCDGVVLTDEAYVARLVHVAERREARRLDREIATAIVDALLQDGSSITCCVRDPEPQIKRFRRRDDILELLFDLEDPEIRVHKRGRTPSGIRFVFGEVGWDCVADYSKDLAYFIDPIVEPHLPWVKSPDGSERGYRVFVLPSPAEGDGADPGADRAFDEFVLGMHSIFGS
ncbi:MAG: hypothetical protein QHD01_17005 [Bradyrhizobium sp.]|uniref:hypothetical protein n=1 Tax=Bradyrhizobium sp. TaxID=376 RepID=UPI0029B7448C|nr:hypothetical protein [Bradyrhizobium sp.]MDX3968281.1 hypothetical protein [Bradyrhizobium sp.]